VALLGHKHLLEGQRFSQNFITKVEVQCTSSVIFYFGQQIFKNEDIILDLFLLLNMTLFCSEYLVMVFSRVAMHRILLHIV
ncbi:hypothetical protein ACJX0J_005542, partial [Zea mays]